MKSIFSIVGLLLLAFVVGCPDADASSGSIAWEYDYVADTPCTATRTTDCVSGFEITNGAILLAAVPTPASTSANTPFTATFKLGPPYGSITINVTSIAKDSAGARVLAQPQVVILPATPAPVKNLRAN
jgi:hypothetical protein